MKVSSRSLYLSFPLVILLWGYSAYMVYDYFHQDDLPAAGAAGFVPPSSLNTASDTFNLFNNYRDPFLKNVSLVSHNTVSSFTAKNVSMQAVSKNNVSAKQATQPVMNEWPAVQYSGILKNQSNATSLLLLVISGKTYTLRRGEEAEGLKVISFTNTEVTLQRGKEKRVISK